MEHTPGPWKIEEHYGAFRVITASRPIALALYDGGSEDREVMPNARLIAAAPELLAMLKQCRRAFDAMPVDVLGHNEHEGWPYLEELAHRVDAALAKAKGEGSERHHLDRRGE